MQKPITITERVPICQEDGHTIARGFLYDCSKREEARKAHLVCELLADTTLNLIDLNRRIGPTTGQNLFLKSGIENLDSLSIIKTNLGQEFFDEYLNDIMYKANYIADHNITDRITYTYQVYDSCVKELGFEPVTLPNITPP